MSPDQHQHRERAQAHRLFALGKIDKAMLGTFLIGRAYFLGDTIIVWKKGWTGRWSWRIGGYVE